MDTLSDHHKKHLKQIIIDKEVIRQQLDRMMSSTFFSHSKRIPAFLKFVTEQTILGQNELLKERTLGVEIFGRETDYDTGDDSIVRVTAAEIRKRIAQYYQECGHENELRISLPSGSYVPYFCWPETIVENEKCKSAPINLSSGLKGKARSLILHFRLTGLILIIAISIVSTGIILYHIFAHLHTSQTSFWAPVINSNAPILLCIADQRPYPIISLRDASNPERQMAFKSSLTTVIIDDLNPIIKIGNFLQTNNKQYTLKGESTTSLFDLRNGPVIFIGAFDNVWTLRFSQSLRYRFSNSPDMTEFGVIDSAHPFPLKWKINRQQQIGTNNYEDYAIVARFIDPTTGKLAIIIAGVGLGGTIAAAEFVTNSDGMVEATRGANKRNNIEIVLSTQIIDGEPGTPKVETTYFW